MSEKRAKARHPEGCVCRHGAVEDEDCEFLFITNKPFDIFYEE